MRLCFVFQYILPSIISASLAVSQVHAQSADELDIRERQLLSAENSSPPAGSKGAVEADISNIEAQINTGEAGVLRERIKQEILRRSANWGPAKKSEHISTEVPDYTQAPVAGLPDVQTPTVGADNLTQSAISRNHLLQADDDNRRVLTRPGAVLITSPDSKEPLAPFTILRVVGDIEYTNGTAYLQVSEEDGALAGFVDQSKTVEWNSMLVMRYAPKGARRPVVFFEKPLDIEELLASHFYGTSQVEALYGDIRAGTYDPEKVVAIEPETYVDQLDNPYFMPIINFKEARFDDDNQTPTYLLELAAVTLKEDENADNGFDPVTGQIRRDDSGQISDIRIGIVFAVDATTSMGPHIAAVKDFMRDVRVRVDQLPNGNNVGFGLVAYRDNIEPNPAGIEYVSKVVLELSSESGVHFNQALEGIQPSKVSTQDWREDAYTGIQAAVNQFEGADYDARFVILVTDAGPRGLNDPLAADPRVGPRSIGELVQRSGISLRIVHVETQAGRSDLSNAQNSYSAIQNASGSNIPMYFSLNGDTSKLGPALQEFSKRIVEVVAQYASSSPVTHEAVINDYRNDPILRDLAMTGSQPLQLDSSSGARAFSNTIGTDLFRFQQEYLGKRQNGKAPDFYRAWVSDKDLENPRQDSMDVNVLITRNQLGDLASRLKSIVDKLDNKETGARDAFTAISATSGVTVYDPQMRIADFLPKYIDNLPYGSRFMLMTADTWAGLGGNQQDEILKTVKDRIYSYENIYSDRQKWMELPGRSGGEEVYPLDLDDLP